MASVATAQAKEITLKGNVFQIDDLDQNNVFKVEKNSPIDEALVAIRTEGFRKNSMIEQESPVHRVTNKVVDGNEKAIIVRDQTRSLSSDEEKTFKVMRGTQLLISKDLHGRTLVHKKQPPKAGCAIL